MSGIKGKSKAQAPSGPGPCWAMLGLAVLLGCAGDGLRVAKDGAASGDAAGASWDVSATGGAGGRINGTGGVATGGIVGVLGGTVGSGGVAGTGLTRETGGATQTTTSIAVDAAGAAGGDAALNGGGEASPSCGDMEMWDAITRGAHIGAGYCLVFVPDFKPMNGVVREVGYVVLDGNGRVVDNTALTGVGKQAWLDGLSTLRFPCLAGQTVHYMCIEMPI